MFALPRDQLLGDHQIPSGDDVDEVVLDTLYSLLYRHVEMEVSAKRFELISGSICSFSPAQNV